MSPKMLTIGLAITGVLIVSLLVFIFVGINIGKQTKNRLSYRQRSKKKTPIGRYMRMYHWLSSFPLTRQGIINLHKEVTMLSVHSYIESRIFTVKLYLSGMVMVSILIIIFTVLFQNPIYMLICIIFSMILRNASVNKKLNKIYLELLHEELDMLSLLRQEFTRTRSVTDALGNIQCGKYIARSIREIHEALTSSNAEEKLEAFSASTPLPTLQTLASISFIVNNKGDAETESKVSVYNTAIDMIANEVRMAVRKETKQKQLFGTLEFLPVVPLFLAMPLKWGFTSMIPGTLQIYEGTLGYIFTIIILLASLVGYHVIINITRSSTAKLDDRSSLDRKIMRSKRGREIANHLVPKNRSTLERKQKLLRDSMTRNNLAYLYLRKTYMSFAAFILCLLISISGVFIGKAAILKNVAGKAIMGSKTLTAEEERMLRIMDTEFFNKFEGEPTDEQAAAFIREHFPRMRNYDVADNIRRLNEKKLSYDSTQYSWWMLWLCFLAAFIAYQVPEKLLTTRKKVIFADSQEDCLQAQTTVAIMMYTTIDTLGLLEYMYKNSRVFKSVLIDCYHNYVSDPLHALRVTRSMSSLPEFKTMISKLSSTVFQGTILDAFSDLVAERDHMLRMREDAQIEALLEKRQIVKPFAMAALVALISLYFIAPICLLAYSMFVDMMSSGMLSF